jgi:hypothetical protein
MARHDLAFHEVRPLEQPASQRYVPGLDQPPDLRAGSHAAADVDARDHLYTQAEFPAELLQQIYIARLPRSESKILADENRGRSNTFNQNTVNELVRTLGRKFAVERKDEHLLDAFLAHQIPTLLVRVEQSRRPVRGNHACGMRIEGEDGWPPAVFEGFGNGTAEQTAMTGVYAVEVPDGNGTGPRIGTDLGQAAEDAKHLARTSDDQAQSVVRQAHTGREVALGRFVGQVVADVRKECASRIDSLDIRKRLGNGVVGWMGLVAERIEKQDVEAAEFLQ